MSVHFYVFKFGALAGFFIFALLTHLPAVAAPPDAFAGWNVVAQQGHTAKVTAVDVSPDGRLILSASNDKVVKIWELKTGYVLHELVGHQGPIWGAAFSPNGSQLASGDLNGYILVWDVRTGKLLRQWKAHNWNVEALAFGGMDGRQIVTRNSLGNIRLWDASTGRLVHELRREGTSTITDGGGRLGFAADGTKVAAAGRIGVIWVWSTKTGELLHRIDKKGKKHDGYKYLFFKKYRYERISYQDLSFHPDGQRLVSGDMDSEVRLWDLNAEKLIRTMKGHEVHENSDVYDMITATAISPDGKLIASADGVWRIMIWDVETGKRLKVIGEPRALRDLVGLRSQPLGNLHGYTSLAFTPDSRKLVAGHNKGTIEIWNVSSGRRPERTLPAAQIGETGFAVVTSKGERAISTIVRLDPNKHDLADDILQNGYITGFVWNTRTGKRLRRLNGGEGNGWKAAFSPDGRYIAWARQNSRTVTIQDARTGRSLHRLVQASLVGNFTFAPDSTKLAVAGTSGLKLWDVAMGQVVYEAEASAPTSGKPPYSSYVIAFSPDGSHLASAFHDGKTAKVWDAATGALQYTVRHDKLILQLVFSPNNRFLVTAAAATVFRDPSDVVVWDAESGRRLRKMETVKTGTGRLVFEEGGSHVSLIGDSQTVVWDIETGRKLRLDDNHQGLSTLSWEFRMERDPNWRVERAAASIRIIDRSTGELISTHWLLPDFEWVSYLPNGYYNASHGAERGHLRLTIPDNLSIPITKEYRRRFRVRN